MSWEGKGGPEGRQGMRAGVGPVGAPVSGLVYHFGGDGILGTGSGGRDREAGRWFCGNGVHIFNC